jgi:hypothetical protein
MTSKENLNENLHKPISGIFAKKFMGPHCNALVRNVNFSQFSLTYGTLKSHVFMIYFLKIGSRLKGKIWHTFRLNIFI